MKNSAIAIKRLTTVLLMALCLFSIAIPAVATATTAPEDPSHGSDISQKFELPLTTNDSDLARWSYRTFGFDISGLLTIVGCVLIIGCSIALIIIFLRQRKEKKSEKSQIGGK